jgi:hypothetical protein
MVYVLLGRLPVSCTFSNACVLLLRAWSWATSDPWAPLTRVDGRACRGGRSPLWLPPQPVCVQRACVRVARRIPMHPCPFLLLALVLFRFSHPAAVRLQKQSRTRLPDRSVAESHSRGGRGRPHDAGCRNKTAAAPERNICAAASTGSPQQHMDGRRMEWKDR